MLNEENDFIHFKWCETLSFQFTKRENKSDYTHNNYAKWVRLCRNLWDRPARYSINVIISLLLIYFGTNAAGSECRNVSDLHQLMQHISWLFNIFYINNCFCPKISNNNFSIFHLFFLFFEQDIYH